ncbi:MAG: sulfatase family protein [Actinomycetota bacterium]
MRRIRPPRTITVSVVLASAVAAAGPIDQPARGQGASAPPPNILVIVTDDQRAGSLSVMPSTRHWFRKRGLRFPDAFVTTPLCCPSRASIFTGRYAHNHGVQSNNGGEGLDPETTLQRSLRDAGYQTGIAGKYFNGWDLSVDPPHFDRWAVFNRGYFDSTFNVNGKPRTVPGYSTDFLGRKVGHFLNDFEAEDDRPWLLFVAPHAPHRPATPATRHKHAPVPPWNKSPAVRERNRSDKPPFVQDRWVPNHRAAKVRAKQLRSLMAVDDLVEGVMADLGALGERGNTLAIFVSDNGYLWREHGWLDKRLPYLPSVEVPLYLRWPGHLPEGEARPGLVANIDIAPTVLEAAGVSPDPGKAMDGRSLFSSGLRERLLLEYWREGKGKSPTWASTITTSFQYTEYYEDDGTTTTFVEYYDLTADPWQLVNLLGNGKPGDDPSAESLAARSLQLAADRRCAGTEGPVACP